MSQSGPELVLCLLLAELSNPFMHLRAMFKVCPFFVCVCVCSYTDQMHGICTPLLSYTPFFSYTPLLSTLPTSLIPSPLLWYTPLLSSPPKELGLKDTPIALGNEVLFAASFALCRIALGPFLTYAAVTTPTSSIVVKVRGVTKRGGALQRNVCITMHICCDGTCTRISLWWHRWGLWLYKL